MSFSPLLSVITPVKNGARYLKALIESVRSQDYRNFEHIIIDDGSDDGGATIAILEQYEHLRWWSRENKGPYPTINEGLAAAEGEIVSVICADDMYYSPKVFSKAVHFFEDNPGCDLVYGKIIYIDAEGRQMQHRKGCLRKFSRWWLRLYSYISHCSMFVKKNLVTENRIWLDGDIGFAADWDWIIRLTDACSQVGYIPEPLSRYRVHSEMTTMSAGWQELLASNIRVRKRHSGPIQKLLFGAYRLLFHHFGLGKLLFSQDNPRRLLSAPSRKTKSR